MTGFSRNATAKSLQAWPNAGPVDRGVGDGLTFFAKEASAREGKASWILRYRHGGRQREKVIGRYPDRSLKDAAGAPTAANDAMRYLFRMFHFAVKRKWIDSNPVYGFEIADAGGTETSRDRWLSREELSVLAQPMRETATFGRINELAV